MAAATGEGTRTSTGPGSGGSASGMTVSWIRDALFSHRFGKPAAVHVCVGDGRAEQSWATEPLSQHAMRITTLMQIPPIVPKGQALRRAVAWLAEQGPWTPDRIDQASQRFDLSPVEEEFLLQESRRFNQQDVRSTRDR
jgi:hypothetical protein